MQPSEKKSASNTPFISVIMPVRNEALFIEMSLGALLRQTHPSDRMEILIADGMSTDATREIISRMAETTEIPITVVDNHKKIAATGLNCALSKATGDIIIRIDGHCEIEPDYIRSCVTLLQQGRADAVGGPIETIGETARARAISIAMSSAFGVGGSAFRTVKGREMYTDTAAFPGYTREIIQKAGAFNEELVRNQDDEYNYRIRKLGGRILLSPSMRSRYVSRSTFMSLWRQYFQYGYWKVRVLQMHPRQMSFRQFVPLVFVISLILLIMLSFVFTLGKWALAAVILSYLAVNLTASVIKAKTKILTIPLLSLSFAILHLSYGLGFLIGLVSFRNRWNRQPLPVAQIELNNTDAKM